MSCGFIVHAPSAIDELETSFVHQRSDESLGGFGLFLPPPREKGHFHVDKSATKKIGKKKYLKQK
jgi:hypothetical protein